MRKSKRNLSDGIWITGIENLEELAERYNRVKAALLREGISFQELMVCLPVMIVTQFNEKTTRTEVKNALKWFEKSMFLYWEMHKKGQLRGMPMEKPRPTSGIA